MSMTAHCVFIAKRNLNIEPQTIFTAVKKDAKYEHGLILHNNFNNPTPYLNLTTTLLTINVLQIKSLLRHKL